MIYPSGQKIKAPDRLPVPLPDDFPGFHRFLLVPPLVVPLLPCFLSFAAGAMIYVVVEELIPEMSAGEHSDIGVVSFAVGFMVMLALDVALG